MTTLPLFLGSYKMRVKNSYLSTRVLPHKKKIFSIFIESKARCLEEAQIITPLAHYFCQILHAR